MIHPEVHCVLVTPEQTVCDVPAEFVALPLFDGELGVAPGRTPMIGRLGCGELRIVSHGETVRYYVEGGFVEVTGSVVNVLTSRAIPAEDIDLAVAEEQLATARSRPATTPDAQDARTRAVDQARAQLRVARRAK